MIGARKPKWQRSRINSPPEAVIRPVRRPASGPSPRPGVAFVFFAEIEAGFEPSGAAGARPWAEPGVRWLRPERPVVVRVQARQKTLPADGFRHDFGGGAAIYLMRPGASTRVRTWTPMAGPLQGFLITHNESISIADYYSVTDGGAVAYRPTVRVSPV
jgi:hypothetical protein